MLGLPASALFSCWIFSPDSSIRKKQGLDCQHKKITTMDKVFTHENLHITIPIVVKKIDTSIKIKDCFENRLSKQLEGHKSFNLSQAAKKKLLNLQFLDLMALIALRYKINLFAGVKCSSANPCHLICFPNLFITFFFHL